MILMSAGSDAHGAGQGDGVSGYALGMAFGLGVFEIQRVAQRFQRHVVGVLQILHGLAQHLGAGADDLFEILLVVVALLQCLSMVEGALHGVDEMLALEGLEQVVVSAAAHGVDGHADVVNGGNHDDGKLRLLAVNALEQRDAVAVLHDDVGEDQVEGVPLENFQAFAAAGSELDVVALALERGADHGADMGLVVDDQNPGGTALANHGARVGLDARE